MQHQISSPFSLSPKPTMPISLLLLLFLSLPLSTPTPTLTVSPTTLTTSNTTLTLTYSDLPSPSSPLDWVGIYSPPNSSHNDFIGYLFLSAPARPGPGSGEVTVSGLVPLASGYEFRVFRWEEGDTDGKHHDHDQNPLPVTDRLLAKSGRVGFQNGMGPGQFGNIKLIQMDESRIAEWFRNHSA